MPPAVVDFIGRQLDLDGDDLADYAVTARAVERAGRRRPSRLRRTLFARRSWGRVQPLVAGDGSGNASENLRCFIAVFGHGDGLPETIERVRRVLAAGTPDRLRRHIAVQAALSSDPDADTAGTLYVNWLFKPGTPDEGDLASRR